MLAENPIDLFATRKATLARCLEAAINPGVMRPASISARFGKLCLGLFRPFFRAFQNIFEKFGCHDCVMTAAWHIDRSGGVENYPRLWKD
jgi:hypothetical protein